MTVTDIALTLIAEGKEGGFMYYGPDDAPEFYGPDAGSISCDRPITLAEREGEIELENDIAKHEIECELAVERHFEERGYWDAQEQDCMEANRGAW